MAGVYIAYPFCSQKCAFCNFASGPGLKKLEGDYQQALIAELALHPWEWTPETVYLGGGTPSRIEPVPLEAILAAVPGKPWQEATIEASPGTVTPERAAAWKQAGITRVSLGVQSFVHEEVRPLGRNHTPATVAGDVALLKQAGLEDLNIDLIAGLPRQNADSWSVSLDWVERLDAEHVSVYMLEIDEDSRLGREILAGGSRYGAAMTPDEGRTADLYEQAVERLAGMGLRRYEISNFARPGRESLHNLKYWRLAPYAGFGADAHSFDGRTRWSNVETAGEYVDRWRSGEPVVLERQPARPAEERFFVGLRLSEGISPTPQERSRFSEPIARFLDGGLMEERQGRLRLTGRGMMLSNEVFQEFLPG